MGWSLERASLMNILIYISTYQLIFNSVYKYSVPIANASVPLMESLQGSSVV